MARVFSPDLEIMKMQRQDEMMRRQAVASGMVDKNSAEYRHAKLNGWQLPEDDMSGKAGRKWIAAEKAASPNVITDSDGATARRGSISGFGADMDTGRLTRYAGDGQGKLVSQDVMPSSEQVFQQYGNLIQQGNQRRQKEAVEAQRRKSISDAALGSALVYAKQNNGFMPTDITEALSEQLGMPIVGGNFTQNGDFVIYGRKQLQAPNGMVRGERIEPIAIASPEMQYKLLKRTKLGQSMQQEIFDKLSTRFTEQQLKDHDITNPSALSQKDALALANAQMKERKGMFDMRTSQIDSLMAQRKALVEEGNPDNQKAIAAIDQQIGLLNQMNGAATGVSEFARALGVTGLGGNDANSKPSNYKETPPNVSSGDWVAYGAEETVESNGKQVPRATYDEKSMVYTVNKKHQQDDGTYSLKLKEGQSHYGKKWVTRVKDGKVERRLRNDQDMKTEQIPSMGEVSGGVTMSQGGKSVYIPAGKVIRFEGRNYKLEGNEGSYELVPTDEEVTWRAKDALKGFDDVMLKRKELRQNKKKESENKDKEAFKLAVDHPWISGWSNTRLR